VLKFVLVAEPADRLLYLTVIAVLQLGKFNLNFIKNVICYSASLNLYKINVYFI